MYLIDNAVLKMKNYPDIQTTVLPNTHGDLLIITYNLFEYGCNNLNMVLIYKQ